MKFEKNILIKVLISINVFVLLLSLNTTSLRAQVNSEFEMKLYGANKVLLKHHNTYVLYASIKNNGTRPLKFNSSLINSEYFHQTGICWELQVKNGEAFISYDSIQNFNINDVNYGAILSDENLVMADSLIKYSFNPFEVYTPEKDGEFRVRLIYKDSESPHKYSDWFYLYCYETKRKWKNHED